jgi:hypothetical protein
LAYYDQGKPADPDDDPFKELLEIDHHGQLTELSYTKRSEPVDSSVSRAETLTMSTRRAAKSSYRLENALTMLYDHVPANTAISLSNYNPTDVWSSLYNINTANHNPAVTTSLYDINIAAVATPRFNNTVAALAHSPDTPAVNNAPRPFPPELAGLGVKSGR